MSASASATATVALLACLPAVALLTALLLPLTLWLAPRIGAVDIPSEARRMHTAPTPRCGGLAIFFALWGVLLVAGVLQGALLWLLLATTVLLTLGLCDDAFGVAAPIKLAVQLVASAVVVLPLEWPVPASISAVLWLTLLTNAHNMIDGIDALAATAVAVEATALAVLLNEDVLAFSLAIALLGGCLGYLPYNVHPARLFMGDEGALVLGFTVGWLTLRLPGAGGFGGQPWRAFLVCLLPLSDLSVCVLRRLLTGKNPLRADRAHLHHLLVDRGLSQRRVCLYLCLPATLAAVLAVCL